MIQTERRRTERRQGERRHRDRRQGERRVALRRQDHELRAFLSDLMADTARLCHRLQRFDVLSAGGNVVVRSKCQCGEWVRAHLSAATRECMGPALKKTCRTGKSRTLRQLELL